MKRILWSVPVWVVLADMLYGFSANIAKSWSLNQQELPKDGLPVAPQIAFDGLQVLANGGMILIIGFGLLVLLRLNRTVLRGYAMKIGIFSTLGLLAVLAFSLPSVWEWFWALIGLLGGRPTVSFDNPRYLVAAMCQPLIAVLCVLRLFGWYRLSKQQAALPPDMLEPVVVQQDEEAR
ncbi:hypothetical protein [Neisseria sp.]|uniref:hypothetical protein n=1 Tax=Neisseria sp. TaxID=192066 RepID=UPI00289D006E|nr:hypothetical protein [Neisseria sp.]